MGTLALLQAAKLYWESLPEKYEGKRFYHISTDEVYGALELTHPEGIEPPFTTTASSASITWPTERISFTKIPSITHILRIRLPRLVATTSCVHTMILMVCQLL